MMRLEITVHILCLKYAYLEWPAGAHHDEGADEVQGCFQLVSTTLSLSLLESAITTNKGSLWTSENIEYSYLNKLPVIREEI